MEILADFWYYFKDSFIVLMHLIIKLKYWRKDGDRICASTQSQRVQHA